MRARIRIALLVGCLLAVLVPPARAAAIGLQPVGTFSSPIHVTSPPGDPRLFVVERAGRIQAVQDGVTTEFLDIHTLVDTAGERGLLSIAFDPSYASSGLFYVFFNDNGTAGGNLGDIHVDEFSVGSDPKIADPGSRRRVLTLVRGTTAANHNGGQLQFGPDGLLYVSVGDAADSASAQSLASPHGKILRIDPHGAGDGDYGVPSSNPFVGVSGALGEIWSLGLRNPYRFSFDHLTGGIAIGDVGEGSFEEIDYAPADAGLGRGANFGWPCREGFDPGPVSCTGSFMDPVFAYPHSDPGGGAPFGCAIIGGFVYRGTQVPELAGRYLYVDLCTGTLRSLVPGLPLAGDDRSEGITLSDPFSFGEDSSCELYLAAGSTVSQVVSASEPAVAPSCAGPPSSQPGPPASRAVATTRPRKRCRKRKRHRTADAAKQRRKRCKKRRITGGSQ